MAMFNSYVKLPEGKQHEVMVSHLKAGGEARGQAAEAAHGLHPDTQHALRGRAHDETV